MMQSEIQELCEAKRLASERANVGDFVMKEELTCHLVAPATDGEFPSQQLHPPSAQICSYCW
jgi:hypothetical protein